MIKRPIKIADDTAMARLSKATAAVLETVGITTSADAREALTSGMRPNAYGVIWGDEDWRMVARRWASWRPNRYGMRTHEELLAELGIHERDLEALPPCKIQEEHIVSVKALLIRRGYKISAPEVSDES